MGSAPHGCWGRPPREGWKVLPIVVAAAFVAEGGECSLWLHNKSILWFLWFLIVTPLLCWDWPPMSIRASADHVPNMVSSVCKGSDSCEIEGSVGSWEWSQSEYKPRGHCWGYKEIKGQKAFHLKRSIAIRWSTYGREGARGVPHIERRWLPMYNIGRIPLQN